MQTPPEANARRDGLSNIMRNLAWLIGGKGFGAVCSLVYLAVLSRSLGLKDFGHFSLIFGTAQALVAITGFQTWQTMVRFGASAVVNRDWPHFGRLTFLCGAIDIAGALVGCLVAGIVFYGFAHQLELNPAYVDMAFWFNCALLLSRMTTPNGVVRVLDRFDVGSYVEAVVPLGRLIGSGIILLTGPSVAKFLFVWAFFDLLSAALYWYAAWRLAPDALQARNFGQWRHTLAENPGISGFFGVTYLTATFDALTKQGPLLAVGYFLGTSAAGLYRLADQLAQGVKQFSTLIARAIFPEFAISQMADEGQRFDKLVRQVTRMAALAGLAVVLLSFFFGEPLLQLIGGDAFAGGAGVLLALAIGAAFELASVSYEPMLYSTGHAIHALRVRLLSLIALAAAIPLLAGYGPIGVGWAVAIAMAIFYFAMSITVWLILRENRRKDAQA